MAVIEDFLLSLYQKWPLSKRAFFSLLPYRKQPLWAFINNGLFCCITLQKAAFIGLYRFIESGLYWPLSLHRKAAFIGLYRFIKSGLYWPLSKIAVFALSLYPKQALLVYLKQPLLSIFHFIPLSRTDFIALSLYRKWLFSLHHFFKNFLPIEVIIVNRFFFWSEKIVEIIMCNQCSKKLIHNQIKQKKYQSTTANCTLIEYTVLYII